MDKKFISNILWAFTGQLGYILVGLAGNVALGRLLVPEDFGVVGIAMFFVGVTNVLVESGMGGALVRKENATQKDYSTIFIFNLLVSIFLYILLVVSASFIADFYKLPILKKVIWVVAFLLIINAFTITQNAKLVKDMKFKKRGLYKIISLSLAVIISVIMAYFGYGVWAIIALQVLTGLFLALILWIKEGGVGTLVFSKESFKEMYSFGIFTTLASILNSVFDNIYQLILGKYFSISQTGYYYQAKRLQEVPDTMYNLIILQVVYSHLSKLQSNLSQFKISYNSIAKFSAIILGITTSLTFIYSEEIILLLYGKQWLGSVFFLQLLVISAYFTLQEMLNRNIFKIFNQTHKILYLELVKKGIQSVTIIIGIINQSIELLLYGLIVTSFISYFINFYYSRKIINNISKTEIITFVKIVFSGIITTFIILLLVRLFDTEVYFRLIFIPFFILLYLTILYVLNINLIKIIKSKNNC